MSSPGRDELGRLQPGHQLGGPPTLYTEELAQLILDEIAAGKSMLKICEQEGMPHRATVIRWMGSNIEFASRVARMREGPQAEYLFESMAEIEEQVLTGQITSDVARVVLQSRQWRSAKLAPKKFGDRIVQEHAGEVTVNEAPATEARRKAALALLLARE